MVVSLYIPPYSYFVNLMLVFGDSLKYRFLQLLVSTGLFGAQSHLEIDSFFFGRVYSRFL